MIKANEATVRHFLFADDCAPNTATKTYKQLRIDCFSTACDNIRGVQSVPKKLTFYTSLPHRRRVWYTSQHCQRGNFQDRWQRLTYLVSTLSRSAQMDDEVNSRIAKFSPVYGRLSDTVWQKRGSWKNSRARQRCCLHYCMPVKHAHYTSVTSKKLTNFTITA